MCGIPNEQQPKTIMDFSQSPHIKLNEGKIFIKDVPELVKQTSFYRKQRWNVFVKVRGGTFSGTT